MTHRLLSRQRRISIEVDLQREGDISFIFVSHRTCMGLTLVSHLRTYTSANHDRRSVSLEN